MCVVDVDSAVGLNHSSLSLKKEGIDRPLGALASDVRFPTLELLLVMTTSGSSCPAGTGLGNLNCHGWKWG